MIATNNVANIDDAINDLRSVEKFRLKDHLNLYNIRSSNENADSNLLEDDLEDFFYCNIYIVILWRR